MCIRDRVNKGEIISILGRNGAGKTTTIKSIMGLAPPSEGNIILKGSDISYLEPHEIAKKGISYVPASRGIFSTLTAYENINIFHMKNDYLNIYNNLIKLTRNKNLYYCLKNNDIFSDRLIIFLFHFGFF